MNLSHAEGPNHSSTLRRLLGASFYFRRDNGSVPDTWPARTASHPAETSLWIMTRIHTVIKHRGWRASISSPDGKSIRWNSTTDRRGKKSLRAWRPVFIKEKSRGGRDGVSFLPVADQSRTTSRCVAMVTASRRRTTDVPWGGGRVYRTP